MKERMNHKEKQYFVNLEGIMMKRMAIRRGIFPRARKDYHNRPVGFPAGGKCNRFITPLFITRKTIFRVPVRPPDGEEPA